MWIISKLGVANVMSRVEKREALAEYSRNVEQTKAVNGSNGENGCEDRRVRRGINDLSLLSSARMALVLERGFLDAAGSELPKRLVELTAVNHERWPQEPLPLDTDPASLSWEDQHAILFFRCSCFDPSR
jgi:hypothetical protein